MNACTTSRTVRGSRATVATITKTSSSAYQCHRSLAAAAGDVAHASDSVIHTM